ncbi:RNA polymerase sigma factor [Jiulongibacter sp. NS-SX5]|uniref:RNA polymerase sigma factor n=1 Tax=Jiulongibacter sp. NS-SX5 TaxID=3463854 RepID=UPI004058AE79
MDSQTTHPDFLELIKKCMAGDRMAQKELYQSHYGFAMSICLRYCQTKDEALEVVNDAFLKVFNNLKSYNTNHSFKNWFKRILINASIDFYRSQKKHYHQQDIDTAHALSSQNQEAEGQLGHQDLMALVYELSPNYKTNFCLFAIDGYSHEEISKMMGISIGTSKSNVSRARKELRARLESIEQKTRVM